MSDIHCPVCLQIYGAGESFCQQCGWELESEKILGNLSTEAKVTYLRRLEIAQHNWQRLLKFEQPNHEMIPRGSYIQDQINTAISEENWRIAIWLAKEWLKKHPDDKNIKAKIKEIKSLRNSLSKKISSEFKTAQKRNNTGKMLEMIKMLPLVEKLRLPINGRENKTIKRLKNDVPYVIFVGGTIGPINPGISWIKFIDARCFYKPNHYENIGEFRINGMPMKDWWDEKIIYFDKERSYYAFHWQGDGDRLWIKIQVRVHKEFLSKEWFSPSKFQIEIREGLP